MKLMKKTLSFLQVLFSHIFRQYFLPLLELRLPFLFLLAEKLRHLLFILVIGKNEAKLSKRLFRVTWLHEQRMKNSGYKVWGGKPLLNVRVCPHKRSKVSQCFLGKKWKRENGSFPSCLGIICTLTCYIRKEKSSWIRGTNEGTG